jgi:hypothetical protein
VLWPTDPDRTAVTASLLFCVEPLNEVARVSMMDEVDDDAAPGGSDDSYIPFGRGRETVDSIDFRPESRLCAVAAKPVSEPVGVEGESYGESAPPILAVG